MFTKIIFKTLIATALVLSSMPHTQAQQNVKDSTVTISANPNFEKGRVGRFFFGNHYRETWTTPVSAPIFDLDKYKGGLEILKLGGGNQTKTLRLTSEDNIQYNLRTIDKFPAKTLPSMLRGTWVNNILKDQISTAHPYSFLTIPPMSDALGIYYTDPKLFYVPANDQLGEYSQEYGDKLFMIEIRPDEDLSEFDRFGNTENAVGTEKLYEELREDNDNSVDQLFLAKARIFDMIIGDWDRHEDQWRWAEFEKDGKGVLYKAIPRDRDQVFAKMDGFIPSIGTSRYFMRRIGHFDYDFNDINGFNWSARNIDRNLLNELQLSDWQRMVKEVQTQLTDSVIDYAIKQIPEEVYELSGPEIAAKIKSRRDLMDEEIVKYYEFLSREVRVAFSDKHELFEVYNQTDNTVKVVVHKVEEDGKEEDLLYERTFHPDTTKRIILHGLRGIDRFKVYGEQKFPIEVQMYGGEGKDSIISARTEEGRFRGVKFYDKDEEFTEVFGEKYASVPVRDTESSAVYDFERKYFKYDIVTPRASFDYTPDDGLFLGAGLYIERQQYKEDPKATHLIKANWATRTNGFNAAYNGRYNSFIAKHWDVEIDTWGHNSKYAFNYFGQGGNTTFDQPIDYYRVGLERFNFSPSIIRKSSKYFEMGFGPTFEHVNVTETDGVISDLMGPNNTVTTGSTSFLGASFFTRLRYYDHPNHPSMGIKWQAQMDYWNDIGGDKVNMTSLKTDVSLYYTFKLPFRLTVATRFGVENNSGSYLFYHSNFLGGQTNLRGFRRTRFAGQGIFYNNTEFRLSLFQMNNVVMTGDFGLIGFVDHGKVWTEDGETSGFKRTYGPGAFAALYNYIVVSLHYGITEEESGSFMLRAGFLF